MAGCNDVAVRSTRLIYVENDPALRGIMTRAFHAQTGIELLLSTPSAADALAFEGLSRADAALLDLALGAEQMNGIELGLAMRERNANIGIVVYSQYSLRNMARRVPQDHAMGWSFVPKTGDMRVTDLASVIRATAKGMSHNLAGGDDLSPTPAVLEEFTPRQRAVMALASTGLTGLEISRHLGISHDAVRKDLSAAYRLLLPDVDGGDLRTKAVLVYLQLMRGEPWDEGL